MECYACDNEATRQCRRCGRTYCEVHGGDLCAECLSPASALPSFNLYRGSLLALLVGTAIAIWLLVRPTGDGGEPEVALAQVTPSPNVAEERTPDDDETPSAQLTATPDDDDPNEYTVEEGDTLTDIAERFAPPGVDSFEYAEEIAEANGFSSIDEPITLGQTLTLP